MEKTLQHLKSNRTIQGLALVLFVGLIAIILFIESGAELPDHLASFFLVIFEPNGILITGAAFSVLALLIFQVILRAEERAVTAAAAARRDTRIFRQAIDDVSDHIVIADTEGKIIFANRSMVEVTGYKREEMIGKKAGGKDLWGGQMSKEFYDDMWKTIKVDKRPFGGQLKNKTREGKEFEVYLVVTPILDERGNIEFFVGVERNITKEKAIDRAKSEFVSLASHQLRTPLSTVSWYAEMLLSGDVGDIQGSQREYLEEIYKGNRRMVELVNALLNVSRLEVGSFSVDPEPTHIIPIAESVLAEIKPIVDKKALVVLTEFGKDLPVLNADPKLLRIVFQNLLSNAAKYTPEGGRIGLHVLLDDEKQHILLKVSDTGWGIPKEQREKIFSKLFRADNVKSMDTEGTGLGLYIVKSIVEQAGGTIWFESEMNKGTTFTVTLPLTGMKHQEGTTKLQESLY